jgi:2-phosphosulfolactate phosphatase
MLIQNIKQSKGIEVCLSPALFPFFDCTEKIVVIVDILRASSVICAALQHGVKFIYPVSTIQEAFELRKKGYLVAAERNGIIVDDADIGNSPLSYLDGKYKDKTIALTTTNGTKAIEVANINNNIIVIGSFLNFSVLLNWLENQNKDIVILCAGWKNHFNLEDTVFTGALVNELLKMNNNQYTTCCDSALASIELFKATNGNILHFLTKSSHFARLKKLNLINDINYCFSFDKTKVIPMLKNKQLVDILKFSEFENVLI